MTCGLIAGLACWLGQRSLTSAKEELADSIGRTQQMQADAVQIETLRIAPRLATERVRPNDELIAQVEAAMGAANLPPKHWVANDPAPAVRIPRSPYQQMTVRLSLEDVSLRQVVEFAHALLDKDPGLSIPRLRLTASPKDATDLWNADVGLAYLVYSPQ